MRYIYNNPDHEQGPSIISDDAESIVDSVAAAIARGDFDYAYTRAQDALNKSAERATDKARKHAQDMAEEENRMRAQFGHGKAEFRTLDGLVSHDKCEVRRDKYYMPIWKRACRAREDEFLSDKPLDKYTPVKIRTYEFRGIAQNGLPIYEEVS